MRDFLRFLWLGRLLGVVVLAFGLIYLRPSIVLLGAIFIAAPNILDLL